MKKDIVNSDLIKEASRKKRLLNYIIDLIVRFFLFLLFFKVTYIFGGDKIIAGMGLIIFPGYYILMEYFLGKTIGKIITKTKVIDIYGNKIDFRTAVNRYLCRWIPFEFFSLGLGYDAKAWHDTLTKTYVIDEK